MPAQDEYTEVKPPSLWSPTGQPKVKCSVRSCHNPASDRGLCRRHLGNRGAGRLKAQVREEGIERLRKSQ
jgi:hypothetical protein